MSAVSAAHGLIRRTTQPGTTIATYGYDGLGRRISNNPAGGTVDYYYNENYQVVEVRKNGDSDAYEQYVWDQRYIDAPVMVYRDTNTDGTVDQKLYVAQDANFNVTATINGDSGSVVNRFVCTHTGSSWSRIHVGGPGDGFAVELLPQGGSLLVGVDHGDPCAGGPTGAVGLLRDLYKSFTRGCNRVVGLRVDFGLLDRPRCADVALCGAR